MNDPQPIAQVLGDLEQSRLPSLVIPQEFSTIAGDGIPATFIVAGIQAINGALEVMLTSQVEDWPDNSLAARSLHNITLLSKSGVRVELRDAAPFSLTRSAGTSAKWRSRVTLRSHRWTIHYLSQEPEILLLVAGPVANTPAIQPTLTISRGWSFSSHYFLPGDPDVYMVFPQIAASGSRRYVPTVALWPGSVTDEQLLNRVTAIEYATGIDLVAHWFFALDIRGAVISCHSFSHAVGERQGTRGSPFHIGLPPVWHQELFSRLVGILDAATEEERRGLAQPSASRLLRCLATYLDASSHGYVNSMFAKLGTSLVLISRLATALRPPLLGDAASTAATQPDEEVFRWLARWHSEQIARYLETNGRSLTDDARESLTWSLSELFSAEWLDQELANSDPEAFSEALDRVHGHRHVMARLFDEIVFCLVGMVPPTTVPIRFPARYFGDPESSLPFVRNVEPTEVANWGYGWRVEVPESPQQARWPAFGVPTFPSDGFAGRLRVLLDELEVATMHLLHCRIVPSASPAAPNTPRFVVKIAPREFPQAATNLFFVTVENDMIRLTGLDDDDISIGDDLSYQAAASAITESGSIKGKVEQMLIVASELSSRAV
ncbi:MAG: hypothetical protein L6Q92_16745 [Phycisphaerae bacterium]|nr:hypothetical protein [Phycisphaerae bacterium]